MEAFTSKPATYRRLLLALIANCSPRDGLYPTWQIGL